MYTLPWEAIVCEQIHNFRLALILVLLWCLTVSLPLWAAEIVILHTNDVIPA